MPNPVDRVKKFTGISKKKEEQRASIKTQSFVEEGDLRTDRTSPKLDKMTAQVITLIELMRLTSSENLDLNRCELNKPHPALTCNCNPPSCFVRRSGAKGPFWGCPNYKNRDEKGCGTLNDNVALQRLKKLRAAACDHFGIIDDEAMVQEEKQGAAANDPDKLAEKFVKPPVFRALFSPVGMRERSLVGSTPVNHAPNLAPAPTTGLRALNDAWIAEADTNGGTLPISPLSFSQSSPPASDDADEVAKNYDLSILETPLTFELLAAFASAKSSGVKLTSKSDGPTILPTADNQPRMSHFHVSALKALKERLLQQGHACREPFVFAYGGSRRNAEEYEKLHESWRSISSSEQEAVSASSGPLAWVTPTNDFVRVSSGIDYLLHCGKRSIPIAIVEPWMDNAESASKTTSNDLTTTTLVPLEWHGSARYDIGRIKSSLSEKLLVPCGLKWQDGHDELCWELINLHELRRVLFSFEAQINESKVYFSQQKQKMTDSLGQSLVDVPRLMTQAIPSSSNKYASSSNKREAESAELPANDEIHDFHRTHAHDLLCGPMCRVKPSFETSEEEAMSSLVQHLLPGIKADSDKKVGGSFTVVSVSSEAFYISAAHDRYLVTDVDEFAAFIYRHNLSDCDFHT